MGTDILRSKPQMPVASSKQEACTLMPSVGKPLLLPVKASMLIMHEARVAPSKAEGGGYSPLPPEAAGISVIKVALLPLNELWQRKSPVNMVTLVVSDVFMIRTL